MTVFRLLVYPGNTNLNDLNPPSERAMGYIGFHCTQVWIVSVSTNYFFFNTPSTLECSFKFLFRAHAGFIIAQLKTLSISRGCQRNNNTLIRDWPFSSLGTAMYLKKRFFRKSCFSIKSSGRLFKHLFQDPNSSKLGSGDVTLFRFVLRPSSLS